MSTCTVVRFHYSAASLKLNVWDDKEATISDLISRKRGRGHATNLLLKVINYINENELRVLLYVEPYGTEPGLTSDQLISFYRKFGFRLVDKELLWMRRPRTKN